MQNQSGKDKSKPLEALCGGVCRPHQQDHPSWKCHQTQAAG